MRLLDTNRFYELTAKLDGDKAEGTPATFLVFIEYIWKHEIIYRPAKAPWFSQISPIRKHISHEDFRQSFNWKPVEELSDKETLFSYVSIHPEITEGHFSWYDRIVYYGVVNGQEVQVVANILNELFSLDAYDRGKLLKWDRPILGEFFTDVKQNKDTKIAKVTYFFIDVNGTGYPVENDTFIHPEPADEYTLGEFKSYEEFIEAVSERLDNAGVIYDLDY